MTLLLDAESRLFVIPDGTQAEPEPARPRDVAQPRAAAPAAAALSPGRTLDDVLSASWEGLSAGSAVAACPVCDGELVRRWSAGAGVVGGRCRDCGSELS